MAVNIADWRDRLRYRIRQRLPSGVRYDQEAEDRLESLLNMPVPSDEELRDMQQRGELPSDEELARARH